MIKSFLALSFFALVTSACKNDDGLAVEEAPFPEIEKIPLLVIHHKKDGGLIHYLALRKVPEELQILVEPATETQDLYVTVLGRKRHDLLKRSLSISSQVGESYLGKVTVIVENGMAVSIDGNGFHSPALVSDHSLGLIEEALAEGKLTSEGSSTITIPK